MVTLSKQWGSLIKPRQLKKSNFFPIRQYSSIATDIHNASSETPLHKGAGEDKKFDIIRARELQVLKVKGEGADPANIRKIATILAARMRSSFPTLLDGYGPLSTKNMVRAIINANGILAARAPMHNISSDEVTAFRNRESLPVRLIEELQKLNRSGEYVLDDIIPPPTPHEEGVPPSRDAGQISLFGLTAEERSQQLTEKLQRSSVDQLTGQTALLRPTDPPVLGFIPFQPLAKKESEGENLQKFLIRFEPCLIDSPPTLTKEMVECPDYSRSMVTTDVNKSETLSAEQKKVELLKRVKILPPTGEAGRSKLYVAGAYLKAEVVAARESGQRELPFISAIGTESISRAVKMILLANQILENEGHPGICVRPISIPIQNKTENPEQPSQIMATFFDVFSL